MMYRRFVDSLKLTHHETGIAVVVERQGRRDSWATMRDRAIRILKAKLWAHKYGMNTELAKTYHTSAWGTWTKDHRTGERRMNEFLGMKIKEGGEQ